MRKNLQNKILISLLMAGSIGILGFNNITSAAMIYETQLPPHPGKWYTANDTTDGILEVASDLPNEVNQGIAGKYFEIIESNKTYSGNQAIITGGSFADIDIFGVVFNKDSSLTINNIDVNNNKVIIDNSNNKINFGQLYIVAGACEEDYAGIKATLHDNSVYLNNIKSCSIDNLTGALGYKVEYNKTTIENSAINISWNAISGGIAPFNEAGDFANHNTVEITNSEIGIDDSWVQPIGIIGGYARGGEANYNEVIISGNSIINCNVYGGLTDSSSTANNNSITLKDNANLSQAELIGGYNAAGTEISGNKLIIDNWTGKDVKGAYNFSDIDFNNIGWNNGGTVLNITGNAETDALANTNINLNDINFTGGTELNEGESMTFVNGTDLGIGTGKGNVTVADEFTAGVAVIGTGEVVSDANSIKYVLKEVKQNQQIDLVAENRAVAAAFVNQGTDLISDSLDTLSRDGNYGVKTFAAVHGNRSKYDVNSDLKINGWSTIVGVGNAAEFADGDEFSWGVFYENGSGNYRTFNEFNNEFFRGDGSLVYNGGGIAARYENASGVYTEGSLRAGMLKSEMDNALRDGSGNYYGYNSESAYYGAHIGVGKIISLSDSSDLDIYGKFFHTYTEGDSVTIAEDKFDFDSITSDRLRIGARITSNKENKFSTYYGLAYEYEFNGDADMTAQGLRADTQSLQGSSVMAEVGFNYQPTPDSPWSFDLNMRGYAGERQGGSFNVQATYTF